MPSRAPSANDPAFIPSLHCVVLDPTLASVLPMNSAMKRPDAFADPIGVLEAGLQGVKNGFVNNSTFVKDSAERARNDADLNEARRNLEHFMQEFKMTRIPQRVRYHLRPWRTKLVYIVDAEDVKQIMDLYNDCHAAYFLVTRSLISPAAPSVEVSHPLLAQPAYFPVEEGSRVGPRAKCVSTSAPLTSVSSSGRKMAGGSPSAGADQDVDAGEGGDSLSTAEARHEDQPPPQYRPRRHSSSELLARRLRPLPPLPQSSAPTLRVIHPDDNDIAAATADDKQAYEHVRSISRRGIETATHLVDAAPVAFPTSESNPFLESDNLEDIANGSSDVPPDNIDSEDHPTMAASACRPMSTASSILIIPGAWPRYSSSQAISLSAQSADPYVGSPSTRYVSSSRTRTPTDGPSSSRANRKAVNITASSTESMKRIISGPMPLMATRNGKLVP